MSKELNEKCIEYGIDGHAKEFLEGLEESYDEIAKVEKEKDEFAVSMIEWIHKNIENAGKNFEGFTDEQMFFVVVGILADTISDMIQNM